MTTPSAPQSRAPLPALASLIQLAPGSAPPVTPPRPQPTGEPFTPLAQPVPGTVPYMPLSQPQQQRQPMYAPPPMYAPATPTNTMAILALMFSFLFWPLAIVSGHTARLGLAAAALIVLIIVVTASAAGSSVPAG